MVATHQFNSHLIVQELGTTLPPGPEGSAVSFPWTCPSPFLPPIASSIGKGWRVGPNPHGEPCPGGVSARTVALGPDQVLTPV